MKNDSIKEEDHISDESALMNAKSYLREAYAMQMRGNIEEAMLTYQKSIDAYPTAEAYTFFGWAYSFIDDYDSAIESCMKAIELDPDYGNSYNDIGAYYIQKNKFEEALYYLEKAKLAARYATPYFSYYNIGRIYERRGLWFEARREFEKALKISPTYVPALEGSERITALLN